MTKQKTFLNWSSGKDCAFALYQLLQEERTSVEKLFTTVSKSTGRIGMHGLRETLLRQQAQAIGLDLEVAYLPENNSLDSYNQVMHNAMQNLIKEGYSHAAFGDIFLEDLRMYREEQLSKVGLKGLFPLWKNNTKEQLNQFVAASFKSVVVAASGEYFDKTFPGTKIDEYFLDKLPIGVDPCGENGEFHTFCYDGPIFANEVKFKFGERKTSTYPAPKGGEISKFHFIDLIPIS